MPTLTVVICTYNRPALLQKCLESLKNQTVKQQQFEVLVVDNYGDSAIRKSITSKGLNYHYEATPGLSVARNRGAKEVKTDWVFYLDDDAIAHPDMLAHFFSAINHPSVQVIGGRYDHYFVTKPAKWLMRYYQHPVRVTSQQEVTQLKEDQYLSGGIMAARREILLEYPFRTDLGMKGQQPGFGEENEWQDRLRRAGIPIFYYDKIAMDHLVQEHKQKIADRIALAYAHGKYLATQAHLQSQSPGRGYLPELARIIFRTIPYDIARMLFKQGFYWQNGLVSTLGKIAFLRGKYGK